MRSFAPLAAMVATLLGAHAIADAQTRVRVAGSVLGDIHVAPEMGGHGAQLLAVDVIDIGGRATAGLLFDTDTLRLSLGRLRVSDHVDLGVDAAGQLGFAGLLPDYYRDGARDADRGLRASVVGGSAHATWSPASRDHVRLTAGARRWFFEPTSATDPALVLPEDHVAVEGTLAYTRWNIADSTDFAHRQRRFPRVRGVAAGVEVGLIGRTANSTWGAIDPEAFEPRDVRNDPADVILRPRLWVRAGQQVHDRLRWQLHHAAAYGFGEDDITRDRLGGLNPYVVPISGSAWASFLSARYAAVAWSWHVRLGAEQEVGVQLDGALIDDARRTGRSDASGLFGSAVFADLRFRGLQVDLRVGHSPTVAPTTRAAGVSFLAAVGWGSR